MRTATIFWMLRLLQKNQRAVIVSNAEIAGYYAAKGFQSHPMNHSRGWILILELKFVITIHSSSFPDGSYGNQVVLSSKASIKTYAGDTALNMDMKLDSDTLNWTWFFCQ
jgi:hypothetical protein